MGQKQTQKVESNSFADNEISQQAISGFLAGLDKLKGNGQVNLIGILQDVQDKFGYLPAEALEQVSNLTKIPLSKIYGVVSFYSQFYTTPHGKHTVRCCSGTACHVKGAERVIDKLSEVLGIEQGQSTPDGKFHLETVACLGTCFLAPVMMIDEHYYGNLTAQDIKDILNDYRSRA